MFKITNLMNRPRVFTVSPKETFRLLAYETKKLEKKKVTEDMRKNEVDGLLNIKEFDKPVPKEVPMKVEKKSEGDKERGKK